MAHPAASGPLPVEVRARKREALAVVSAEEMSLLRGIYSFIECTLGAKRQIARPGSQGTESPWEPTFRRFKVCVFQ